LVDSEPDVILCNGPVALMALREATLAIPIVFVQTGEPVDSGLVPNLLKPGGNTTVALAGEDANESARVRGARRRYSGLIP